MQAAGMIMDYSAKQQQIEMQKQGQAIEQAGIESNIMASRLNSEEESLTSLKQLRANLGTQAAVLAARGTRAGAGTAALFPNESVGNFNSDERLRKINESGREAQLKAGITLSNLHEKTSENKINNEFTQSVINKIPTSPEAWSKIGEGFSAKNSYGFGLTKVGS
jgi:hypothetical protein